MDYARDEAAGGAPFGDEKDQRLLLIEQQCIRLAWEAIELIYRTVGTSDAAKDGAMIGRIFRNMAVINTHPALQLERTAINAARTRFGLVVRRSASDTGSSPRTQPVRPKWRIDATRGNAACCEVRFVHLVARLDLARSRGPAASARRSIEPAELRVHPVGCVARACGPLRG